MNLGIKDISTDKRNFSIANSELYEAALPILEKSDDFRLPSRLPECNEEEALAADYSVLGYPHTGGYPKPDKDYGYEEITYDKTKICPLCCSPRIQKDAFRVTRAHTTSCGHSRPG